MIPPLLPTVFVVSVGISAKRLQANRIACSYQEGILIAGKVNSAFFDKTGTLTKQGMDFISLDAETTELEETATIGMGVCHTLHKTMDGQMIGNHVDAVSFKHAGGELIQTNNQATQIKVCGKTYVVLKQYEFDSHRTTQSVIVKGDNGKTTVFVKGKPEAIRALCTSGVPFGFQGTLDESTKSGVYQLAIASKEFANDKELKDITRDEVESQLCFNAFLNFRNTMREETPGVIRELVEGDVTVAIITGDSVLAGIFIAKESGIVVDGHSVLIASSKILDGEVSWCNADSEGTVSAPTPELLEANSIDLAISGQAWTALLQDDPKYATSIAKYIRVFGRCTPSDKVAVISHFVTQGRKGKCATTLSPQVICITSLSNNVFFRKSIGHCSHFHRRRRK